MEHEWYPEAKTSGIRQLQAMAATLLRNAEGVLSYCKTVLTSGKMEGLNRKIDGLFSGSFGFRNQASSNCVSLALHEVEFVG